MRAIACRLLLGAFFPLLAAAQPASSEFTLQEYLGRNWRHEAVRFSASPEQMRRARARHALVADDGSHVPYQVVDGAEAIEVLTDLKPHEVRRLQFSQERADSTSDLVIEDTGDLIRVANSRTGIAIRKSLGENEAPIAAVRVNSGRWIGGSALEAPRPVSEYSARVVARGPVYAEVLCRVQFGNGDAWTLRVRLQAGEPATVVHETFSLGDDSAFVLWLNPGLAPRVLLHRRGRGTEANANAVGEVVRSPLSSGGKEPAFVLEPWLHWWERERQGNWFGLYGDDDDFVFVGALRPSVWVDPQVDAKLRSPAAIPLRVEREQISLRFPLRGGERRWLIGALGKREVLTPLDAAKGKVAPLPQAYVIKHGDFPLSRVRDFVLHWAGPEVAHPRLFVTEQDLPRIKTGFKGTPRATAGLARSTVSPYAMNDAIGHFFATQSPELGARLTSTAIQWTQDAVDSFFAQSEFVTVGFAPHHQSRLFAAMGLLDAVWSSPHVSTTSRDRLAAQVAFLAYTVSGPDYWSPERGFAANPNMTTTVAALRVILACMIPTHPMARTWVSAGMRELKDRQLDTWSDERGGWLEAPHYALVSFDHMLGAFLASRNAGFEDHVHHPRMKLIAEWLAKISTPPEASIGGLRHLPAIGHTYVREPTGEFGLMAHLWKDKDPRFAGEMQWMHRQQGSPIAPGIGGFHATLAGYRRLLIDEAIPERVPAYGSDWFPRTGAVMRSGFPSSRETQVHLIAGDNHSHYDRDSGSITLWGKGRLISGEFGYTGNAPGDEHSMAQSPRASHAALMQVVEFSPGDAADHLRGVKGTWERRVLLVKDADPLGASFVVLRDKNSDAAVANWRQWFGGAVTIEGRRASIAGKEDVDTDVVFLPAEGAAPVLEEKTLASWGMTGAKYGRVSTTQTAITLPIEAGGTLTTVIYPRLKGEKPPTFTSIAGGRGILIESHLGRDYAFIADDAFTYEDGVVSFRGTVGSARVRAGKVTLSP